MALNGASSKIFAILSKKNLNISAHDRFTSLIALAKINVFFGFCSDLSSNLPLYRESIGTFYFLEDVACGNFFCLKRNLSTS